MGNIFDQFDETESSNIFDQFDAPTQEEPEDQSFFRSVADVPLKFGQGAVMGTRMISDAFGASNEFSDKLQTIEDYIGSLTSAQSKQDSEEVSRIMAEAEGKGIGAEVMAGLKSVGVAPIDFVSNAAGTIAPIIAGTAYAPVGAATTAVGIGLGSVMGAGVVKSAIHEGVRDAMIEAGLPEEKALEAAEEAQKYSGENLDQIALGTVLGAWAARSGIEPVLAKMLAKKTTDELVKKGIIKRVATGAFVEGVPEGFQGGQERLAKNVAQQREGFDVPTWEGVAGQGTMEMAAGAILGGGLGAVNTGKPPAVVPEDVPRETPLLLDAPQPRLEAPTERLWQAGDILAGPDGNEILTAEKAAYMNVGNFGPKPPPPGQGPVARTDDVDKFDTPLVVGDAPFDQLAEWFGDEENNGPYLDEMGNILNADGSPVDNPRVQPQTQDSAGNLWNADGSPASGPLGSTPDMSLNERRGNREFEQQKKELAPFHRKLVAEMRQNAVVKAEAIRTAYKDGVFKGYDSDTKLKGKTGPLTIEGYSLSDWKDGNSLAGRYFKTEGITPTLIDVAGKQYIPMLKIVQADGTRSHLYLDGVKYRGMQQFTGPQKAPLASTAPVTEIERSMRREDADQASRDAAIKQQFISQPREMLMRHHKDSLVEYARRFNIPVYGTKNDLIDRIQAEANKSDPRGSTSPDYDQTITTGTYNAVPTVGNSGNPRAGNKTHKTFAVEGYHFTRRKDAQLFSEEFLPEATESMRGNLEGNFEQWLNNKANEAIGKYRQTKNAADYETYQKYDDTRQKFRVVDYTPSLASTPETKRKPWVEELTPEAAKIERDILGDGSWTPEQVNQYWMNYGGQEYTKEESWDVAENYAAGLADDHGVPVEGLIDYLRGKSDPKASTSEEDAGPITIDDLSDAIDEALGEKLADSVNIVTTAEEIPGYEDMLQIGDYEGLYDPKTKQVWLIADNISSSERAQWVAWHELFHRGVRVEYGHLLTKALINASKNGTVNELARAIMKDRGMVDSQYMEAVEEALAELNAASRTGYYDDIKIRYKVTIPESLQAGWRNALKRFMQTVKNIFTKVTGADAVSDADIWGMFYGSNVDLGIEEGTDTGAVLASRRRRVKSGATKGQYVGYPEGIDNPTKLRALLKRVRNLAKEGMYGRFWYERSGKEILRLVNGNKSEADKLVQAIAVTSPTTPVGANFDYATQAYLQWKRGKPIRTGKFPAKMGKKLTDIFNGLPWEGRKTNNFYNNLMREIDPSRVQGVTADVWMMRAFGFFQAAPSEQMYNAVEGETAKIAKQLGWEPQQVQAAIWVALKARMQNNGVKKETDRTSEENGWIRFVYDNENKRVREVLDEPKHMQNWLAHAMKYIPTDLDKKTAGFDYADAAANTLAQVSWETRPGITTDHMPEAQEATDAILKEYHVAMSKAFLDADGNDYIAKELGIPSPHDFEAPGYFEGRLSPGTQTELLAPRKFKSKAYGVIEPSAEQLINAYAAARGILLRQDAMGWHRPWKIGRTPSGSWNIPLHAGNGAEISIGRPFTGQEIAKLAKTMADLSGHTEFNPIASPNGVRLINWEYLGGDNRVFQELVQKGLDVIEFDNNEEYNIDLFHAKSGYITNNWKENPNGERYYADGITGQPDLQRRVRDIVTKIRPRVEAVEAEFAGKYGWTRGDPLASTKPTQHAIRHGRGSFEDSQTSGVRGSTTFRREDSRRGITLNDTPTGGSKPIRGIHYSNSELKVLSADKYGTGYKGKERERVAGAADPRIKRRVYFYIDKSTGMVMRPEDGVGSQVHTQTFGNVLNMLTDKTEIAAVWKASDEIFKAETDAGLGWPNATNALESAILDAGYDGYATPQNGMMVILNHDVPVNYQGTSGELTMEGSPWQSRLSNSRLTVAESSDVMSMLGEANLPITVLESKLQKIDKEHSLTDKDWDKVPEWLANPLAVFESETEENRLVFIAPEPAANGNPVYLIVAPQMKWNATKRHLLVSAYDAQKKPIGRWIREGKLEYLDAAALRGRNMDWLNWPKNINVNANRQGLPKLLSKHDLDSAKLSNLTSDEDQSSEPLASVRPHYANPELQSASERVGQGETWKSKWQRFRDKNWGAAMNQAVFDRYYGIKQALEATGKEFAANINGYVSARLSTSIQDRMAVLLKHGQMKWEDGVLVPIEGTKGFLAILEPISDKIDDFGLYLIGLRAAEIGPEKSGFTSAQITAMINLGNINPEFKTVQKEYMEFNTSVLDIAMDAGLINGVSRELWESDNYVPFYRIMEEGTVGPRSKRGLAGQVSGIRKLVGSDKHIGDPIENIMMNWSHLLDASVKNKAVLDTVSNLQGTGLMDKAKHGMQKRRMSAEAARLEVERALELAGIESGVADMLSSAPTLEGLIDLWSIEKPSGDDVVKVMNNGNAEYYTVNDTLLLRSLTAITQQSWGNGMEFFRAPKRVLTAMVTADPAFMARNFIRDTLGAFILSRDPMTPGVDAVRGFAKAYKENPEMVKFMAAGGTFSTGGYLNASDPGAMKRFVKAETHHAAFEKTLLNTPKRLWDFWQHLGASVENANRVGIGLSAIKSGKDMAQAAYEMKDIMDFSMRGDHAAIQFLAESVPFFSARLQGMQRLGRGAMENPQAFAAKGMMLTMAAMALYMSNREDDRYKELEEWDKDTYFHFWLGDEHYRLPKPFEVGVIFGTFPERMVEAMISEDTSAVDFLDRMWWNAKETLSLNPIPQVAKPLVESWANRSFFRDRPIVGMRLKNKAAEGQYEPWTSATMRELGQKLGISPKHAESLMRGYFGTIGSYVLAASDVVTRRLYDFPEQPTMKLEEMPVISAFYRGSKTGRNTKYMTEFYDMVTEVDGLYNAVNGYRKEHDPRAGELRDENFDKLKYRDMLTARRAVLGQMNERIRQIYSSRNINGDEKQRMIEALTTKKNKLVQKTVEAATDYDN